MKLVKTVKNFRIYELNEKECVEFNKLIPTYVCWYEKPGTINTDIGNLERVEYETCMIHNIVRFCEKAEVES